jgi:hypothetical protein
MRNALSRLIEPVIRDDLVLRVIFGLFGLVFGALGVALVLLPVRDASSLGPSWAILLAAVMSLFLSALAAILLWGCMASPASKISHLARRFDLGPSEESIVIAAIVFLPVILLTVFLRAIGLRGHPW